MSIKDTLKKYINDDKLIDEIVKSERLYDQSDFDNVVSKAKENMLNKYNRDYVSKTDYDLLNSEYNTLRRTTKEKELKELFLGVNGNENYFNDFLKLNSDLMDLDTLNQEEMTKRLNNHKWASLNTSNPIDLNIGDTTPLGEYDEQPYTIYDINKEK